MKHQDRGAPVYRVAEGAPGSPGRSSVRNVENPNPMTTTTRLKTRGLCRDSLWFRGNCVKLYGADRQGWRAEERLESLICTLIAPKSL